MNRFLAALLAFALLPTTSFAWNATGHSVVALLAYRELSAADQKKVQAMLKGHPHYDEYLAKDVPAKANRDEWIVMQAAVWPDWVKGGSRDVKAKYNRSDWHYVNLPVRMLDGARAREKTIIEKNIADTNKNRGHILTALPNAMAGMKDPKSTAAERAVHLCWLLHLAGDLHQPLHAAACFNRDSLDGDLGGNLFFVSKNSQPNRLHALWDDALGEFRNFPALDELARIVAKNHSISAKERAVKDPKAWAEESHKLAESVGYRFDGVPLKGEMVKDFQAKPSATPPALPGGYEAKMKDVARSRAALAGTRLAEAIKANLP